MTSGNDVGIPRPFTPPARMLALLEPRAAGELGVTLVLAPLLLRAPRGDGHPVLVLPGFLAGDTSTIPLRAFLKRLGYEAHAWKLGFNWGGVRKMEALVGARVREIANASGRRVTIVGWSLGGVYGRLAAVTEPSLVRAVITMGTPLTRDPKIASTGRLYELLTGEGLSPEEKTAGKLLPHAFDRIAGDIGLPATALYTRADGIVNWRACLIPENDHAQNIEVVGASHNGLGANASALWAIADRLALPEGTYRGFVPGGPFGRTLRVTPAARAR